MSAAVFLPDPLLASAAPDTSRGRFYVQALLSPAAASFTPDPVLMRAAVPAPLDEDGAFVQGSAGPEPGCPEGLTPVPGDGLLPTDLQGMGLSPEFQALLEQRWREGFEEGLAEGARLVHEELDQGQETAALGSEGSSLLPAAGEPAASGSRDVVLLLDSLSRALQPLLLPDDAATRFEPLKRLALHLAMELVRSELSLSPRAVEALVRRSLQALQAGGQAPLTVELNPQDLALLRHALNDPNLGLASDDPLLRRVGWREDPQLTRGSVRARSDVSMVEDLIQQRLASIIQDMRIQSVRWQQDESALQQALNPQADEGVAESPMDQTGEPGEISAWGGSGVDPDPGRGDADA